MSSLEIRKAHGCRNDVFLVEGSPASHGLSPDETKHLVQRLCNRGGSLFGADGVYFIDSTLAVAVASYYNADGSAAEYCGNGLRCVGRVLLDRGRATSTTVRSGGEDFRIEEIMTSPQGVHNIAVSSTIPVRLMETAIGTIFNQPLPELDGGDDVLFTALSGPNPHLVAYLDPSEYDGKNGEARLERVGKAACAMSIFPDGVNTSFVMRAAEGNGADYFVRTYERGAGFTTSCASGAVAAASLLVLNGVAPESVNLQIRNLGGPLQVAIEREGDHLVARQAGNATYMFDVTVDSDLALSGADEYHSDLTFYPSESQAEENLRWQNEEHLVAAGLVLRSPAGA